MPIPARSAVRAAAVLRRAVTGVVPLLALATAAGAQARQDSARRDTTRVIESVMVRAGYVPRVVGSASAVSVTPDSMPIGLTAPTGGELLRRLPFLYVRQNSRGETELSVRGSESRQAAVFFDGVPLTLTWDARTDVSIIPMAGVQRIEYVRGLSSLLAGPNAIGGTVALRLWEDHDPSRAPERTTRVELQGDQFGGLRTSAVAGGALRHSAVSSVVYRVGGGFRDLPGLARPGRVTEPDRSDRLRLNTDNRAFDYFAGARYEHAQGRYVGVSVSASDGARGVAPELHIAQPRLWRNPTVQRQLASLTAGTGALRSRLGVGDMEVALGYNAGRQDIEAFGARDYREVVGTERGEDRTQSLRVTFDQELGARAVLRGAYTRAAVRYDETLGPAPSLRYAQVLSSAAAEVDLKATPMLTITAGLAHDDATTRDAGGRAALGRTSGTGWRAGATWLVPFQGLRLHASLSERSRFPALRELYAGALNRFVPNPDLRPELARTSEVGVQLVRGVWDAQVVLFAQRIDDAVVRTTLDDGRFFRVNRDRFASDGVEFTTGAVVGRTTWRGDVTYQHARISDATALAAALRRPEDIPRVFGSLLVTAPVGWGTELQGRVRALGASTCTVGTTLRMQAGAGTVDVGAARGWAVAGWWKRARATVQVENLLDQPLYDQCGLPQVGRTLRVGLGIG
jgi:iron complex outermembrane receptor protein